MEMGNSCSIDLILLVAFSLLLLNQYRYSSDSGIMEKNPQFTLLEPSNVIITPVRDDYSQLVDIKKFTFLINPSVCKNYTEGILLLIIVSSNPRNHKNRELIRKTWGKETDSTKIVFLMGIPPDNVTLEDNTTTLGDQILKESHLHGDIVQGNFLDAYRNMTYKQIMGLKWAAHHCPRAKYVLKTDDDVVVYSEALANFLIRDLSPWGARNMIICDVIGSYPALRNNSKWTVTNEEFVDEYYPTYCGGYVILYSQDVVRQLLEASRNATYFWIDDVMVTGILAQSINIYRTSFHTLFLSRKRSYALKTMGPKYAGRFLFGSSNLNLKNMLEIWEARGI